MKLEKLEIYMEMAHSIKKMSPDAETQVGAIMLSSEDRLISSSFNGFLRGAIDDTLPKTREGNPNKYEFIQHAERNMLYNCAYEGIRTKGTKIVCTLSPCTECLRACYQAGVKSIIFDELYHRFPSTDFYTKLLDVHVEVNKIVKYTELILKSKKQQQKDLLKESLIKLHKAADEQTNS